jgi:hypothetical protein
MKCFNHSESDAVAVCKACGKAICHECTTDLGHSIACKDSCVEKANLLEAIVSNAKTTYSNQKRNQLFMPAFFGFMGVGLLVSGLRRGIEINSTVFMALGFIAFGVVMLFITRRWAKGIKT